MAKCVCVIEPHSFSDWTRSYNEGKKAGDLPYGVRALEGHGFNIVHSERLNDGVKGQLLRAVLGSIEFMTDQTIKNVVASLPELYRSDVVISLFEDQGRTYEQFS